MTTYFNLAEYFYTSAKNCEDKPALRYKKKIITYNQLNKLSNQLANYFLSQKIKRYDVIGILNTKEYLGYASMLACLKIGAIYTNIDEENPPNRLEKILCKCETKLLISDRKPSANINDLVCKLKINFIDLSENSEFTKLNDSNLESSKNIIGTNPAYIMFTSGSTGVPKGVTITHTNIISFLEWSIKKYNINSNDIFAQVNPMYFDNSVFDFYTALFSGASLVPIKKKVATNVLELINLVDEMKCTIWFSVPSLLIFLQTAKALRKNTFQTIRVFTFGGEGYPKSELKKLYDIYKNQAKIINVYGPTEGTCICSSHEITEIDFKNMSALAPLGKINPNFDIIIIDEKMHEVKKGQKGELCLIGPNIALGYYNDVIKTNQNFIQNPKVKTHRDIIYRTGDIVYEKNNVLWFAGRIDNQIKHMGYRIELEEIEAALNGFFYINQTAVLYRRTNVNYGKIIAYVASKKNISEQQIRKDLSDVLPKYMIPNIITISNQLPKNANGKVDRKKLSSIKIDG